MVKETLTKMKVMLVKETLMVSEKNRRDIKKFFFFGPVRLKTVQLTIVRLKSVIMFQFG